ncbi:MAG: 50S ribosomal protein L2 [bacterium]|nr:50S ribosomal protein L2 [bacterium]
MPLKLIKPTTSGQRKMSYTDFSSITKKKPEKTLTAPLQKNAGRDASGRISVRHQGGGAKRLYRLIDFKQPKCDVPATVEAIEYDPNRTSFIALIKYEDGVKSYIIAPQELKVGDKVITSFKGEIKTGCRYKIKNIPTGIPVYNIELIPGRGGQIVRSAGSSATILAKEGKYAQVRLPSGEVRMIHLEGFASIGTVSNPLNSSARIAKAGRKRHMGIRPSVRGKAMNPVDHPHGGGEGNTSIGLKHPKTPWGKPALGKKTRKIKYSDPFIVRHRSKKRRK